MCANCATSDDLTDGLTNASKWGSLAPLVIPTDGFAYLSPHDVKELLYGPSSRNLCLKPAGYTNKRRTNIERLMDRKIPTLGAMERGQPSPASYLEEFEEARLQRARNTYVELEIAGELVRIPSKVRGTAGYARKVEKFNQNLCAYIRAKNLDCCFATLSARTPIGLSPLELEKRWTGMANRFISFLHGLKGPNVPIDYFWVKEPTKRGYTHLHFFFVNCAWIAPLDLIAWWWKKQGMGNKAGIDVQMVAKGDSYRALDYVTKYLRKPVENYAWSGLTSMLGTRTFSIGFNLRARLERWNLKNCQLVSDGLVPSTVTNSKNRFIRISMPDFESSASVFKPYYRRAYDGPIPQNVPMDDFISERKRLALGPAC
jgi:hypothetical protein